LWLTTCSGKTGLIREQITILGYKRLRLLKYAAEALNFSAPNDRFFQQKAFDPGDRLLIVVEMALPHRQNTPTELPKLSSNGNIAAAIAFKLFIPILAVGSRPAVEPAAMTMPKAPMQKNYLAPRGKY
jgi:hypothetical protein